MMRTSIVAKTLEKLDLAFIVYLTFLGCKKTNNAIHVPMHRFHCHATVIVSCGATKTISITDDFSTVTKDVIFLKLCVANLRLVWTNHCTH